MSMSPKWAQTAVSAGLLIIFFGCAALIASAFRDGRKEPAKVEQSNVQQWEVVGGKDSNRGALYKMVDKDNNVVCYTNASRLSCVVDYGEAK